MDMHELAKKAKVPLTHPLLVAGRAGLRLRRAKQGANDVAAVLGGLPELPEHAAWPTFDRALMIQAALDHNRATRPGFDIDHAAHVAFQERAILEAREAGPRALSLLATLFLDRLPGDHGLPLPRDGRLLLFYSLSEQPWGFAPWDREGWRLVYVPAGVALATPAAPADLSKDDDEDERVLRALPVTARVMWTMPAWLDTDEPDEPAPGLKRETDDGLDRIDPPPLHQVGGIAAMIQGPMEVECAAVSAGLYLGNGYPEGPAMDAARATAHEWRLLLQVDSDDKLDLMFGDGGRVYVWMREHDIAAGRWDRAWVCVQCG